MTADEFEEKWHKRMVRVKSGQLEGREGLVTAALYDRHDLSHDSPDGIVFAVLFSLPELFVRFDGLTWVDVDNQFEIL